jgi:hypothetical protein
MFRPQLLEQEMFRFVYLWISDHGFMQAAAWQITSLEAILKACNTLLSASMSSGKSSINTPRHHNVVVGVGAFPPPANTPLTQQPSLHAKCVVTETLEELEAGLSGFVGDLNKPVLDAMESSLGRALLLQAVGIDHDHGLPAEVRDDPVTMRLLTSISTRLGNIQCDRFSKLKTMYGAIFPTGT